MSEARLSKELSNFLRKKTASRTEIRDKIWAYIKKHDLQDPDDGRIIIPDEKLATVLGRGPVHMMKLAGIISKHVLG